MSDNEMLYCLIAFILGWLASRHMGNGFSVGGARSRGQCTFNQPKWDRDMASGKIEKRRYKALHAGCEATWDPDCEEQNRNTNTNYCR